MTAGRADIWALVAAADALAERTSALVSALNVQDAHLEPDALVAFHAANDAVDSFLQVIEPWVYKCATCGVEFIPYGRLPRGKANAYHSDECRAEGRRASNRRSWHRNKARWRKGK